MRAVISSAKAVRYDRFRDGRDEMNLVEFPFATLSERTNGTRILEFQRETYCRLIGKPVIRKLTVTGDAKYGLPMAKDEEVYLGLLQLTKLHNDFKTAKVYFTRSRLDHNTVFSSCLAMRFRRRGELQSAGGMTYSLGGMTNRGSSIPSA